MSKILRWLSVCICAVAAAGAVQTAHASTVSSGDVSPVLSEEPASSVSADVSPVPPEEPASSVSVDVSPVPPEEPASSVSADVSPVPPEEPVSSGSGELLSVLQDIRSALEVQPYANYDAYYGSISSTYLEYMRGYLSKLPSSAHYVGARTGQYDYVFAYGADLSYNGSSFSGAATVIRWNTYNNGSMYETYDAAFYLNPGSYLVYSDLSGKYPALASSSDMTLRQILILLTIACLCLTMDHMYQVRKIRRLKRKEKL